MRMDELLARSDFRAHQDIEDLVSLGGVVDRDLFHDSRLRVHGRIPELLRVHFAQTFVALDVEFDAARAFNHLASFGSLISGRYFSLLFYCFIAFFAFFKFFKLFLSQLKLGVGVDKADRAALLNPVERRLGDVEVAGADQLGEVAIEEGQEQGADVGTVNVGVGHDNNAVVSQFGQVKLLADVGAQRDDQRLELVVGQHLVEPGLFDVQNFSAQRQDRLKLAVTALLGRAAGRVTLDNVEFRAGRVAGGAVGQLAGQHQALERPLAQHGFARRPGRHPRLLGQQALADDRFGVAGVLFQPGVDRVVDDAVNDRFNLGVAELGFGLALELGIGHLDRNDGRQPLAGVFAAQVLVFLFEVALFAGVVVDTAGQGAAKAGQVHAALGV